jgi:hypothetical protein
VNHFLRRMALSAIKPGGTIHPALDSVYWTRRDRWDSPWIEENASVANTRVDGAQANPETPVLTPAPLQKAPPSEASSSPKPAVKKTRRSGTEPLSSRSSVFSFPDLMETESTSSARLAGSAWDEQNSHVPVRGSKERKEGTGQATRQEPSTDRADRTVFPRLEPATLRTPSRQPKIVSPSRNPGHLVSGLEKTQPEAARLRPVKPTVKEPDEIQIHIGRIEVTAVHPAPPPAAAEPQRKVPSLDDYLRRRDRRST